MRLNGGRKLAQFKTLIEGKIGDREDAISQQWETMNLLQQTIDNRAGKQDFVFYFHLLI